MSNVLAPIVIQNTVRLLSPNCSGADDWFDADRYLGSHGHKYLGRAARYFLAAVSELQANGALAAHASESVGMVVGTNYGALDVHASILHDFKSGGLAGLSPRYVPNFSINLLAAYPSIKYGYKAFNITLTTPWSAGLDGLIQGAWAVSRRHASAVIAGAAETPDPSSSGRRHGALATLLTASPGTAATSKSSSMLAACRGQVFDQTDLRHVAQRWRGQLARMRSANAEPVSLRIIAQSDSGLALALELASLLDMPIAETLEVLAPPLAATLEPLEILLDTDPTSHRSSLSLFVATCGATHCFLTRTWTH
jgi:hypothetical protein